MGAENRLLPGVHLRHPIRGNAGARSPDQQAHPSAATCVFDGTIRTGRPGSDNTNAKYARTYTPSLSACTNA